MAVTFSVVTIKLSSEQYTHVYKAPTMCKELCVRKAGICSEEKQLRKFVHEVEI